MGNPNNDSDIRSCSVFLKRQKNFIEKETKDFEVLLGYLGPLSFVTIQVKVQSTSNSGVQVKVEDSIQASDRVESNPTVVHS